MIVLGYGEERETEVHLSRLDDGAHLNGNSRFDGLLVSRLDFDLQILDIPNVPDGEVEGLIRYRLRSIYPGNPGETAFDYRVESAGAQQRAIVFISRKATLEKYKSAAQQKPLIFPYSLIGRTARTSKDIRIWFCQQGWAELSVFRAGLLVSCRLVRRKEGGPRDLRETEDELPEDVRALPVLIIASNVELDQFRAEQRAVKPSLARYLSFQELSVIQRKADGLFGGPKRSHAIFNPVARIAGLACVIAALGVLAFYKNVWRAEDSCKKLKTVHSSLEIQSARALAVQKEVDALRAGLSRMAAEKPQDIYMLLSELTRVLGSEVQIRSLQVQTDSFQIEAVGTNPLKLMEGFRDNAFFSSVKLSQVVPDPRLGKERFSFSGVFHAR